MLLKCPVCKEHADPLRKMARASLFGLLMGDKHVFYCKKCAVHRLFFIDVSVDYCLAGQSDSKSVGLP